MKGQTRRECLRYLAAGAALGGMPLGSLLAAPADDSLARLAKAKGLTGFGSCTGGIGRTGSKFSDKGAQEILARECNIVVPENDLKWEALRPNPSDYVFHGADRFVAWAETAGMKVRGHTLLWMDPDHAPAWLLSHDFGSRPGTEAERLLRAHITTLCRRYGDRIFSWDVVNEAVDPATGRLMNDPLAKHLGENVIDIAFDAARRAAPNAVLVYNDFMTWGENSARHREGVLSLLQRLQSRKVPVHMLGVQSHIGAGDIGGVRGTMSFNADEERDWRAFLDAVAAQGKRLSITEFDVSEIGTPGEIETRDRVMADLTYRYMSVMLSYRQLDHIVVWGLLDGYSWLRGRNPREDGRFKRPTLYDNNYRAKPMRDAMAKALRAAPSRL